MERTNADRRELEVVAGDAERAGARKEGVWEHVGWARRRRLTTEK